MVLTWKAGTASSDSRKAKARLVVRGYTDPDLTSHRAESPTLSKVGRHIMLHLCASNKWTPEVGDVKTAFLQGEHGEDERNVYAEPDGSTKPLFGLMPDEVLKLTGSVYGLRTAPKVWFQKVAKDLKSLGFRQHQLDPCMFMKFDDAGTLIGFIGVYVDDFLLCGNIVNKLWLEARATAKALYTWGKWETGNFTLCGVQYTQRKDKSIVLNQKEYCMKLDASLASVSKEQAYRSSGGAVSKDTDGRVALPAFYHTRFRGINGALQWSCSNTRPELSALFPSISRQDLMSHERT